MSLKDKLKKRAKQSSVSEMSLRDLPLEFKSDLEAACKKDRIHPLQNGLYKDQFIYIGCSPGNKHAYLSFYPRIGGYLTLRDIEMILDKVGIVHGIDLQPLKPYLNEKELHRSFIHKLVATASPVTVGKSGYLELYKRPYNSSNQPDLETFDQVAVEDEIAKVHPPIKGQPGMTVTGEEIAPPAIQMADYRINNNIKTITTEEETVLIATVGGYLSRYNQELAVYSDLVLNDDITVHRGNLIFDSHVVIKGNTQENVTLNIGGNLDIEGTVSQTQIHVGGNLTILKGIFGKSESHVSVKGDLKGRYLNEVSVECEGDIVIEKEILNSQTWTHSRLSSPRSTIVGGALFAQKGIQCANIGSDLGLKTLIVAGLDKREYKIKHQLIPEIEDLKERLQKAEEIYPKATAQNKEALENHILDLKGEIESRETEIEHHQRNMHPQDHKSVIEVDKAIYPGITFMIGEAELLIMEKMSGPLKIVREGDKLNIERPLP